MEHSSAEAAVFAYGDSVYRLCSVMLGNKSDAEDALQEVFIKYMKKAPPFQDEEHEKAWLLAVAANHCRDVLRYRKRHQTVDWYELPDAAVESSDSGILDALMQVPEKFRLVLVLHYVEGYTVSEIANIMGKTASAVKMRLQKGRKLLEEIYRKEYLS